METSPEGNMAPRQGWWSRNWKWVVPVGCLGMLASCGCFIAVFAGVLFGAMKNTGVAYTEAVSIAMTDDEVQAVLGSPVETTGIPSSSVNTSNGQGTASFSIPLKGSKAEGTLRVEATGRDGEWTYSTLEVVVPGQGSIDLRDRVVGGGGTPRELAPPTPDAPPAPDAPPPPPGMGDEPQEPEDGEAQQGDDADIKL
jgi:hypothetical protein